MYQANWWWWTLFAAMLLAGVFGGIVRYYWDKSGKFSWDSFFKHVILGIGVSLMAPLFLNSISSTLIKESQIDLNKVFILIGFCIAAAIFAKQFMITEEVEHEGR